MSVRQDDAQILIASLTNEVRKLEQQNGDPQRIKNLKEKIAKFVSHDRAKKDR